MSNKISTEELIDLLKNLLTVSVSRSHWTDPNERILTVKIGTEVVAETSFNVVQQPEYEG